MFEVQALNKIRINKIFNNCPIAFREISFYRYHICSNLHKLKGHGNKKIWS